MRSITLPAHVGTPAWVIGRSIVRAFQCLHGAWDDDSVYAWLTKVTDGASDKTDA